MPSISDRAVYVPRNERISNENSVCISGVESGNNCALRPACSICRCWCFVQHYGRIVEKCLSAICRRASYVFVCCCDNRVARAERA